jgi:hypothetical protein
MYGGNMAANIKRWLYSDKYYWQIHSGGYMVPDPNIQVWIHSGKYTAVNI